MLLEALNRIVQLAQVAQTPTILIPKPETLEPPGTYFVVEDGKLTKHLGEQTPISPSLADPDELLALIEAEDKDDLENAAVFVDTDCVVFLPDVQRPNDDRAVVALDSTPQWDWVVSAAKSLLKYKQRDFVRLLRIQLYGCIPFDHPLPAAVASVKFDTSGQVTGTVVHGRDSMGKSINEAVGATGEVAIPTECTLDVQVFTNFSARVSIPCAVELIPHEQAFALTPYPAEVDKAMRAVLEAIREGFKLDDGPPVYLGSPQ